MCLSKCGPHRGEIHCQLNPDWWWALTAATASGKCPHAENNPLLTLLMERPELVFGPEPRTRVSSVAVQETRLITMVHRGTLSVERKMRVSYEITYTHPERERKRVYRASMGHVVTKSQGLFNAHFFCMVPTQPIHLTWPWVGIFTGIKYSVFPLLLRDKETQTEREWARDHKHHLYHHRSLSAALMHYICFIQKKSMMQLAAPNPHGKHNRSTISS